MGSGNTLSRRGFLGALTALGSISLAACATNSTKASRLRAAGRATGQLPPRGEFVVRNAYVLTMDPKLGDIPRGDVHVRNGMLVAVGPNLAAPGAEEIDGSNRIALPGFIDPFPPLGQLRPRHRGRRRFRLFPGHEPHRTGDDA